MDDGSTTYPPHYKDGVRFFCNPIPAPRSAFLTVCLPAFAGEIQAYHVSCK